MGLVAESALTAALDPGTAGDRYQVVVHVDEATLESGDRSGQAAMEESEGLHVSAETSRRMACDASKVVMHHDLDGPDRIVGRKTRTISPALRRALKARDHDCRFPGCHARHCDAHHVQHWADGGETTLRNLVLLYRRHHRAVHEEGFGVTFQHENGEAKFLRPDGRPLPEAPSAPPWTGAPLAPVASHLEEAGVRIDPHTATPQWHGERLDEAWAIDVLWRPRVDATSHA